MHIDGQLTNNPSDIKKHVVQFYKELLESQGTKFGYLEPEFWDLSDKLTPLEQRSLERTFTKEELTTALFASKVNGAPGPDGFTFKFYQYFWDVVKSNLMLLAHYFYDHNLDLHQINKSTICFIPKEKDATNIKNIDLLV